MPDPSLYGHDYLLSTSCEGLTDYLAGGLSLVKKLEIDLLEAEEGSRVLDLGCGRGETSKGMEEQGAIVTAIDYSRDAVELCRKLLGPGSLVVQANALDLPFPSDTFDRVLIADLIEHVPWDMAIKLLREVQRVLAPGGKALLHTAPNAWFIAVLKRPLNAMLKLTKQSAAVERFAEYERLRQAMHPNELSPWTLRKLMRRSGIPCRTWIERDVLRSGNSEWTKNWPLPLVRSVERIAGALPFRLVLGNDLYAIFEK